MAEIPARTPAGLAAKASAMLSLVGPRLDTQSNFAEHHMLVASVLVNTLRQAGIRRTADLYREALLNPEVARALIQKMPASADAGSLHNLARVLKRSLIVGPMLTGQSAPTTGAAR